MKMAILWSITNAMTPKEIYNKVSEKHCGFIINTGNATAEDVKDVIWEVQRRVKERFQVDLEPEIKFL